MKKSDMTPEQQEQKKKYDREAKQRQRDRQRQEREALAITNANDYVMPEAEQRKLTQHCDQVTKTIAADLGLANLPEPDQYIVAAVSSVVFGLENQITKIVYDPYGMLVSGWFPDAAASEAIEHVHRFPTLFSSRNFTELYNKFLHAVVRWATRNEQCATPNFIQEANEEIAGTYVLSPLPEFPKPEPTSIPEAPSVPSDAQILEQGRLRLLNQLQGDPNIPHDARHYLDGF